MHCWRVGATQCWVSKKTRERNALTPRPFSQVFVVGSVDVPIRESVDSLCRDETDAPMA